MRRCIELNGEAGLKLITVLSGFIKRKINAKRVNIASRAKRWRAEKKPNWLRPPNIFSTLIARELVLQLVSF